MTDMPSMDYAAWRFWFDALQLFGTLLIGVYVWWTSRERVTKKRFEEQDKRISNLEFEVKRGGCPHHPDLVKRMDIMHGEMKELIGTVKGVNRAVDLMNEYLINHGGKK